MSVFNTEGKSEVYKLTTYLWEIGEEISEFKSWFDKNNLTYNHKTVMEYYTAMDNELNSWCEASEAEMAQERSILC